LILPVLPAFVGFYLGFSGARKTLGFRADAIFALTRSSSHVVIKEHFVILVDLFSCG